METTILRGKREMIRMIGEDFFDHIAGLKKNERQEGFLIMAGENNAGIYCIKVYNPSFDIALDQLSTTRLQMSGVFVSILGLIPEERLVIQIIFFAKLFGLAVDEVINCLKKENPDKVISDHLYDESYPLYDALKIYAGVRLYLAFDQVFFIIKKTDPFQSLFLYCFFSIP